MAKNQTCLTSTRAFNKSVFCPRCYSIVDNWPTSHALYRFPGIVAGGNFTLTDFDYADNITILGEGFADVHLAVNQMQSFAS